MDNDAQIRLLAGIAEHAAVTAEPEQLLSRVLPLMGVGFEAAAGCVFDEYDHTATHGFGSAAELGYEQVTLDPSVDRQLGPAVTEWSGAGIATTLLQRLPGHLGVLMLGWSPGPHDVLGESPVLDAALDTVVVGLQRQQTEHELADLVSRVDNAQQLAAMGDYDWHIASDTNRWSDQLYRIYGYEPQTFNASYDRFLACLHPDDRERIQGVHQAAYATGEPYSMVERIVRPDGELRYLSSNGQVIMGATGTPERMRGTCVDITERVLAEQAVSRVSQRFQELVNASPYAVLVVSTDGQIVQANPHAAQLLDADPTGHNLSEIRPQPLDVGDATPATSLTGGDLILDVSTAELSESEHSHHRAVFLSDAKPRLEREAMARRLGQSQQRRRQALEINDNVVQGLTAAIYALEEAPNPTALDLIERTLTAARGMMDDLLEPSGPYLVPGDLVRSQAANLEAPHGTTGAELPSTVHSEDPERGPISRVLIADDSEDIRWLLRDKLSKSGDYEVVGEAADGVEAVERAQELQPDLVLLDMAMPRMDGLQALPLIRAAVPDVRVIVFSGFNRGTLEQEALAAGANRYLIKGGKLTELLDAIADVLDVA